MIAVSYRKTQNHSPNRTNTSQYRFPPGRNGKKKVAYVPPFHSQGMVVFRISTDHIEISDRIIIHIIQYLSIFTYCLDRCGGCLYVHFWTDACGYHCTLFEYCMTIRICDSLLPLTQKSVST